VADAATVGRAYFDAVAARDVEAMAVRWHMTGTFRGDARFGGAIATGAEIDITGCDVLTVRDGKVVHNDAYMKTRLSRLLRR
jgi:hypothetical protein